MGSNNIVQQTYGSTIEQMSTVTLKGRSKAILRIVLFLTVFAVCGFFSKCSNMKGIFCVDVILLLYVHYRLGDTVAVCGIICL